MKRFRSIGSRSQRNGRDRRQLRKRVSEPLFVWQQKCFSRKRWKAFRFGPCERGVLGSNRLRSLMVNDLSASRPSFDVGCSRYPRFPAV
jgi:hypothetical protein